MDGFVMYVNQTEAANQYLCSLTGLVLEVEVKHEQKKTEKGEIIGKGSKCCHLFFQFSTNACLCLEKKETAQGFLR